MDCILILDIGKTNKVVGTVKQSVFEKTGLSPDCRVPAGIHDSSASYLRYASRDTDNSFAVHC